MCANGARVCHNDFGAIKLHESDFRTSCQSLGTAGAFSFSTQVLRRVHLTLQQRAKSRTTIVQHLDILLCAQLVMYSAVLSKVLLPLPHYATSF